MSKAPPVNNLALNVNEDIVAPPCRVYTSVTARRADRQGGELLINLVAPVAAARDLPVVPQFVNRWAAVLQCDREIGHDFAEPANLARLRLLGLVPMAIADKDDRLCPHDRHRCCSDNLAENLPA
jgi:hypothetical protein